MTFYSWSSKCTIYIYTLNKYVKLIKILYHPFNTESRKFKILCKINFIHEIFINEHLLKNVYKEGELIENETMTKFGNSEFAYKPTNYYNLDMIISIGYCVKSQNGILFRK